MTHEYTHLTGECTPGMLSHSKPSPGGVGDAGDAGDAPLETASVPTGAEAQWNALQRSASHETRGMLPGKALLLQEDALLL
jgi:hypothetical protein